ncbi:MAG: DUF4249 domain-containing protein [bacterium]|nr:DUF4249 domain-containing protein [bacterium]
MVKSVIPYLTFALAGLLLSCEVVEPTIPLDYPGDQIVLNGFIARDRIEVFVGRSQDPNGVLSYYGRDTLHEATVELVDAADSVWYQIPYVEKGNYVLDLSTPLPLDTAFRLVANSAGFPEARSELIAIPRLQMDISAALTAIEEVDDPSRPEIAYFTVSLTDNNPSADFFHFYSSYRPRIPFDLRTPFSTNAPNRQPSVKIDTEESIEQQCGILFFRAGFILPDLCFSNERFTFPLLMVLPAEEVGWDSISFTIAATHEFFYESVRSLDRPADALEELLFRPQLYSSNVEGGYGVVVTRHEQIVWVRR